MKPWYQMLVVAAMFLTSYVGHEIVFGIYRSDLLRTSPLATSAPVAGTAAGAVPGVAAGVALEQATLSANRAVIGTPRESLAI